MRGALLSLCAAGAAAAYGPAWARVGEDDRSTPLSELVVTAPQTPTRVTPPEVVLGSEALLLLQPKTLEEALNGLPGVMVRTNSRGEAVARVRGAEERQTQVFLDGAPAAVPWDGRFDMSFLPAALVGKITVVKGGAPIEYGANTVAGVVDLQTRRGAEEGSGLTALGRGRLARLRQRRGGGDLGQRAATRRPPRPATCRATPSRCRTAAPRRSASPTTARAPTPTSTPGPCSARPAGTSGRCARGSRCCMWTPSAASRRRATSTRRRATGATRTGRLTQATLNAEADLGQVRVRGVGWGQWFGQTIDAFSDVTYSTVRSREVDEDETWGGRLTATHPLGRGEARWSLMGQTSTHDQVDITFPAGTVLDRTFRQDLFSAGVEGDQPLGDALQATFGVAYDRATTPETGDKPPQAPMDAMAGSAAVRWRAADGLGVTGIVARRTRFPTARELFGEALGRFQPNSDLRPETAVLGDLVIDWTTPRVVVTVNPFLVASEDTISQRMISVGGVSRRQRFNLEGSTSAGVDAQLQARLSRTLSAEVGASFLSAKADEADGGQRLVQRPDYELDAALAWQDDRFSARAEVRRIGPAVDLGPDGGEVELPSATEFNLAGAIVVVKRAGPRPDRGDRRGRQPHRRGDPAPGGPARAGPHDQGRPAAEAFLAALAASALRCRARARKGRTNR